VHFTRNPLVVRCDASTKTHPAPLSHKQPGHMDRLRTLTLFKAVAEMGSFINAADALDVSASVVSRAVAEFESLLEVRLFERSTRHVALTAEGRSVLEQVTQVLDAYDDLMNAGKNGTTDISGHVRFTAPASFVRAVSPAVSAFIAQHPKVMIDLQLRETPGDLVQEGIDLAMRIAWDLPDTLIARRIGHARLGVFASPAYLARKGTPAHPADIASHDCLRYTGLGRAVPWAFEHRRTNEQVVPTATGMLMTNSGEALMSAAVHGSGLVLLPYFLVEPALRSGALQSVLDDWQAPDLGVYLTYTSRRNQPQRVRVLIDWLARHFEAQPFDPEEPSTP
jgi:DNA-binding transcriptional LysR family regulator